MTRKQYSRKGAQRKRARRGILAPSNMEPEVVVAFATFKNDGTWGDHWRLRMPIYLKRLVESFALNATPRRSFSDTVAFCIHRGVRWVEKRKGVKQILDCREEVKRIQHPEELWFEAWDYRPGLQHGDRITKDPSLHRTDRPGALQEPRGRARPPSLGRCERGHRVGSRRSADPQ